MSPATNGHGAGPAGRMSGPSAADVLGPTSMAVPPSARQLGRIADLSRQLEVEPREVFTAGRAWELIGELGVRLDRRRRREAAA